MRGKTVTLAVFAALAVVGSGQLAASAAGGAAAAPGIDCAYAEADHTLGISSSLLKVVISVEREGKELVVRVDGKRIECRSARATVKNVDRIVVFAKSELALDLRKGRLAPGFTNEGDGSSEIEVEANFSRTGGLRVRGSKRSDAIAMGQSNGRHAVNLNARESRRDVDVTVAGGFETLSVLGRAGRDRISAKGGPEFDGRLATKTTVSAGAGRDRVKGGPLRDLIGGGAGSDRISGGRGTDRIKSVGGADRLRLRDGERDYARCGPGIDRVKADRKDRLAGCDRR